MCPHACVSYRQVSLCAFDKHVSYLLYTRGFHAHRSHLPPAVSPRSCAATQSCAIPEGAPPRRPQEIRSGGSWAVVWPKGLSHFPLEQRCCVAVTFGGGDRPAACLPGEHEEWGGHHGDGDGEGHCKHQQLEKGPPPKSFCHTARGHLAPSRHSPDDWRAQPRRTHDRPQSGPNNTILTVLFMIFLKLPFPHR